MLVVFTEGAFRARCSYEERTIPAQAGFRWNADTKEWYTRDFRVAARVENHLDASGRAALAKVQILVRPFAFPLVVPDGEELMPFQEEAAIFALSRNRSYLGLDPGLGKTPIAAVVAATVFVDENKYVFVYICPPFLTRNTEAEFKRFAPDLRVARYGDNHHCDVLIVPDSIIARTEVQEKISEFIKGKPSLGFIDEAHRYKNDEAARTQAVFGKKNGEGIASKFNKVVYLSGTPMPNRPIELYPVLSHSAPQTISYMNKFDYAMKYCAAFQHQWGWDFSGGSKEDVARLAKNVIGTFMIRVRKSEVLKDLPPKTEEVVVLGANLTPKLVKLSKEILSNLDPEDLMKGRISVDLGKDDLHLSTYRKELGILKALPAAEFIKFVLEETEENLLVFAIHTDVIATLKQELSEYDPLIITGETKMKDRHEIVKTFQNDKAKRLFIGNIQAAGIGLTLTKATRVIFVEFSWVPADNDQASDRAHRIGQLGNVFVQYLVYENSVDKAVIETVLRKKKVTEQL